MSDFSEKFKEKIRIEYFEIHKHYDQIIGDIDIRAESLIEFIHKSREDIQKKVKDFRDESLKILPVLLISFIGVTLPNIVSP